MNICELDNPLTSEGAKLELLRLVNLEVTTMREHLRNPDTVLPIKTLNEIRTNVKAQLDELERMHGGPAGVAAELSTMQGLQARRPKLGTNVPVPEGHALCKKAILISMIAERTSDPFFPLTLAIFKGEVDEHKAAPESSAEDKTFLSLYVQAITNNEHDFWDNWMMSDAVSRESLLEIRTTQQMEDLNKRIIGEKNIPPAKRRENRTHRFALCTSLIDDYCKQLNLQQQQLDLGSPKESLEDRKNRTIEKIKEVLQKGDALIQSTEALLLPFNFINGGKDYREMYKKLSESIRAGVPALSENDSRPIASGSTLAAGSTSSGDARPHKRARR